MTKKHLHSPICLVQLSVQPNIGTADVKQSGRSQKLNKIFEKYGM